MQLYVEKHLFPFEKIWLPHNWNTLKTREIRLKNFIKFKEVEPYRCWSAQELNKPIDPSEKAILTDYLNSL